MLDTIRTALRLTDPRHRRRLYWTLPPAVVVAMLEAGGFGVLFLLLQAFGNGVPESGPLATAQDLTGIEDSSDFLWVVGLTVIALLMLKGLASIAVLWRQSTVLADAEAELASRLLRSYLHAPHLVHMRTNSAVIARNVLASVNFAYQFVVLSTFSILAEAAVIVTIAIVLFVTSPVAALLAGLLLVVTGACYVSLTTSYSRRIGRENEEMDATARRLLLEGVHGATILQVLNRTDDVADAFAETRQSWASQRHGITFLRQLPRYYLEIVLLIGVSTIGATTAAVSNGDDAITVMALLVAAAMRLMPSLNKILNAISRMQVGEEATREIATQLERLQAGASPIASPGPDQVRFDRDVQIDTITFTYPEGDRPALSDVSLNVARGESVGIVGSSGSGKSTLLAILLGLLWPDSGRITVDGHELTSDNLHSWRSQIGFVPQEVYLGDMSLRRNIAFGVPDAEIDDARVDTALRMALLGDVVDRLPDGIDTVVGEHGSRFSGGQRQRIGIARALYTEPRLLLLDEATSALDGVTEAQVAETISSLRGQVTTVIIAHRLSTVRDCDRLVMLTDGRVSGVGPMAELARTNSEFAAMLESAAMDQSAST